MFCEKYQQEYTTPKWPDIERYAVGSEIFEILSVTAIIKSWIIWWYDKNNYNDSSLVWTDMKAFVSIIISWMM